jgi:dihydrodipicolinate reductase
MRIGVCGAGGRMGREVCRAVSEEQDLDLVCVIDPAFAGSNLEMLVPGISESLPIGAGAGCE